MTAANAYVDKARQASANPATFDEPAAFKEFYNKNMGTPEQAMRAFGKTYGVKQPALEPLSTPSVKQGGAWGAAAGGGVALIQIARDGKLTVDNVKHLGESVAVGAGVGALQAKGEQYVAPLIDKVINSTTKTAATQVASKAAGTATAEVASTATSSGAGAVARTMASRVAGSTVVGTVITTGISAWQNRDGLAKGDSKAIGNVAADATVAAGSIAAATAAGAAIGSVVPVAGTAVGAVVGFAVGVGVTYGAQISGVRDAIASGVSKGVDWVKSWF
jgi:hypothetical protein